MEQTYLPGTIRDRIQDLLKERKMTQAELAAQIGTTESSLSRFISGKTDKLGDENIIRIARVFHVSTDFLLGETDAPDRKNYDVSELGLSVQAARNLYTGKINTAVVNRLLENPKFAETTYLISRYFDDSLAAGFAAQNQLYASVAELLNGTPEAAKDVQKLQTPVYQADLTAIQNSFMMSVRSIKEEMETELSTTKALTKQAVQKIFSELTKGQKKSLQKISAKGVATAVAASVSDLQGVDAEQVKQLFMTMAAGVHDDQ